MAKERVLAWTDGSCRGNPGPGGWAALLRIGAGDRENERVDKLATAEADRAGEKDSVAVRVDLEGRLEIECGLAGQKDAAKKAPPYCVRGPGNTGVHCVIGSGEGACPHAFLVV